MNDIIITNQDKELTLYHQPAADEHPALVYLAGLADGSRRTMMGALGAIAEILTGADLSNLPEAEQKKERVYLVSKTNWGALRFQHTGLIRSQLLEKYSPATANKMLSALRGTLKAAWRLGQMTAEDYHRAADIQRVKGETIPAGRDLSPGELGALIQVAIEDISPAGARDAAIISILYSCGLRRAELIGLDLSDYNPTSPTASALRVRGKGNKQRIAHVTGGARAALDEWLALRGDEDGPLFLQVRKGGHIWPIRLTTQAVFYILQERARQAKMTKHISPHDFRRTFVGDLLDAGADIATVQKMAGHADVSTTAKYDRRGEETKRKAAELLHVPYVKKPPKE